jgi:uncharacterized membrane protein
MALLIVAALLWLGLHVGISGTRLRDPLATALGERGFSGAFSLLALAFLALLIYGFHTADTEPLWVAPPWLVAVIDLVMLLALILLAAGLIPARGTGEGPRGIFRVTRHPLMSSIGLWSLCHLLANGDTVSLVFFGTFLLTVLLGVPASDAKRARRDPARSADLFAVTSAVPFGAVLAGRNRVSLAEIGWLPPLAGVVAWGLIAHLLHPWLLGVPATPIW